MKNKEKEYKRLIRKRKSPKTTHALKGMGLKNYCDFGFSNNYVDGWEQWYNKLDAKIMVVGQDYADWKTFKREKGMVVPNEDKLSKTNSRLTALFGELEISLEDPREKKKRRKLFFTNAVVGLKSPPISSKVIEKWARYGTENYLKHIIEIIEPKIIIALGRIPYNAINNMYPEAIRLKTDNRYKLITLEKSKNKFHLFHVYHPAVWPKDRTWDEQVSDWKKIELVEDWKSIKKHLN
jgi:uracil-DNA glycosylase family 4